MSGEKRQNESSKMEDSKIEQVNGGKQIAIDRSTTMKCPLCGLRYPLGSKHTCAMR